MAENLKVTHYNNGDAITTGLNNTDWSNTNNISEGAYSVYNDDPINIGIYGFLYFGGDD